MTRILFATNRQAAPVVAGAPPDFTDVAQIAAPGALSCGTADIAGIDIARPGSGAISAVSDPNPGAFSEHDLASLLSSQNDILVFVHGAANSFQDAIRRAAYNKTWLGAANGQGVGTDYDVIAFSWPARSYVIARILNDYADYRHDQAQARASAFHFGLFLQQIAALRKRVGGRRINLLCHSMGTYMLGGAVEHLFAGTDAPSSPIFDVVVLAAADETATTFSTPNRGRLAGLAKLAGAITVYFDREDIAMALSLIANHDFRLGYGGPPNMADKSFFPVTGYEFVDCTGVTDYLSNRFDAPDRSHQYYRQSPTVRADIMATLAGARPCRLRYDPRANVHGLFPSTALAGSGEPPIGNGG